MGRVIRTFITAGGYRGEGDLDVSAKVAHSGEGEAAGARMPPWPHLSDAAVHRAKQGRNCWSGQWQRKMALLCQRHIKIQQAAESPWPCPFFFLPFGPWAAKSGCGRQPAKRVWLPTASQTLACSTRGWVKSTSPVKRVTASQAHSALQGAVLWGYPAFPASSVEPSSIKTRTTAQIRPILAGRGRDAPPPSIGPHSGPQGQTGAKSPGTP